MPVIMFYGPKLSTKEKEQLVKELANTASSITSVPASKFVTLINEFEPENVGTGTELLANIIKE
ncbi:MAG: 4-oxalocrotonate tautomerase [Firmicutes bacterium]|nr:4-oxalocrotonate tautomerase [Bacillota bacterium]